MSRIMYYYLSVDPLVWSDFGRFAALSLVCLTYEPGSLAPWLYLGGNLVVSF